MEIHISILQDVENVVIDVVSINFDFFTEIKLLISRISSWLVGKFRKQCVGCFMAYVGVGNNVITIGFVVDVVGC